MPIAVDLEWDSTDLGVLRSVVNDRPLARSLRKAGSTAVRDARSEASKRIRQRKRIKAKVTRRALVLRRPRGSKRNIEGLEWAIDVRGDKVPLSAYPHRQTRKGVSVAVNRGKRSLVKGAFIATMRSGHKGVFVRRGMRRLPIRELLGSRPVDALLKEGEVDAVLRRGRASFNRTFRRVLALEMEKGR